MKVDWKKCEEKISNFFTKHIIKVAIVAVVVVLVFYFFNFHYQLSSKNENWGLFGDFFGGTLNPILSFLALFVVLKTYLSQQDELKATQEILKEQSETQKRQQFENTFFELLKIHNQSLESLVEVVYIPGQSSPHRSVSGHSYSKLKQIISSVFYNENFASVRLNESKQKLIGNHSLSGHYFRILYQVLKFIAVNSENSITEAFSTEDIERDDVSLREKIYSNIVRALLPNDLMRLVAVNCYCENGESDIYWRYKLLIERYEFFEHLSFDSDERDKEIWQDIKKHYRKKAFGK